MSTRCKQGDLAIIMNDVPQCTPNIGRIVEVSGPPEVNQRGQTTWLIQPVTPEPYMVNNSAGEFVRFMDWQEQGIEHPDAWVLPIPPDHLLDETEEDRELVIAGDGHE